MAVTPETLAAVAALNVAVDELVAAPTDVLTAAWASAWDVIVESLTDAVVEQLGGSEDTRIKLTERLLNSLGEAAARLDELTDTAQRVIVGQLPQTAATTVAQQAAIIATQLPADYPLLSRNPALDAIVRRSTEQITSTLRPLTAEATTAMRRELVRGVAASSNPTKVARQIIRDTEGAFNGGLSRALTVARTEILDTSRQAAEEWQNANTNVVGEWRWLASLSATTCPSCWSQHGTRHPLSEPGPLDHQNGRCSRVAVTKSWRDLGIDLDEPDDYFPDAEATFRKLDRTVQQRIMGRGRLEALDNGTPWSSLSTRRSTPEWRDSYAPTPVRDLIAAP